MTGKEAGEVFSRYYESWLESGAKSADGIAFEVSFLQMLRTAGHDILQESVGALSSNRNKKKLSKLS